ncbi:MAG: D-alanyl-D-alanine carboxypeptidase, partial [Sphingomonas bacterium]|nr:D-alanyl-D-alanine carboxypeptidase [Sphingomonas bacterium]
MIRTILLSSVTFALMSSAAPAKAPPFATKAKVAFLMDLSSGAVLLDKNGDQRMPPASMAKMMTTNVAFE